MQLNNLGAINLDMKTITFYAHMIFVLLGCYMLQNYNTNTFNAAKQTIQEFVNASIEMQFDHFVDETDFLKWYSVMSTSYVVATIPMYIGSAIISDRIGRPNAIITGIAIAIIGALVFEAAIVSRYFELVLVARIIQGAGGALIQQSQQLYFAEISSTDQRGLVAGIKGLIRSIVAASGLVLGNPVVLGSLTQWTALIGLAFPFGIAVIIRLCFVPDTPTHLMLHNPELAQKSFEFYKNNQNSITFTADALPTNKPDYSKGKMRYVQVLKENKRVFGIVVCTQLTNFISIGALYELYGVLILEKCSLSPASASNIASIISVTKIVTALIAIPIMAKVPRKMVLVGLTVIQQASGVLLIIFAVLVNKYEMKSAVNGCVVAIALGWVTTSIQRAQTSNIGLEACNQRARSVISSLSLTAGRLATSVIVLALPNVMQKVGVSFSVVPLLALNIALLVISAYYLRETGKTEIGTAYETSPLIKK